MELINFQLSGRFAHFLRAEASKNALSYPLPPRTVMLGILGAILGLPKDKPQVVLEPTNIAICGRVPKTHWHRVKLRKDPPAPLPRVIKKTQKVDKKKMAPEKATLILQEWLFKPDYTVWVSVPESYNRQLKERLEQRRWHFAPSLGLSEMMADIEYLGSNECSLLSRGTYNIQSVFPQKKVVFETDQIFEKQLVIHSLRMPRSVTPDRIFSHCNYFVERDGRPVPVETDHAYKIDDKVVMFL